MELPAPEIVDVGDMRLEVERGRLSRDGRSAQIGRTPARIFGLFAKYPHRVIAEERLRMFLYGGDERCDQAVRQHITRCRRAMEQVGSESRIAWVTSYGWEFLPPN